MTKYIKNIITFGLLKTKGLKFIFLLTFILNQMNTHAQVFVPMQDGSDYPIVAASNINNKTIVVKEIDNTPLAEIFEVAIFNGQFWTTLPRFKNKAQIISNDGASYLITSVIEFKGDIYIAGKFTNGTALSASSHLFKFDGAEWIEPAQNIKTTNKGINKMVIWKDTLIAAGFFNQAGSALVSNIAKFDGNDWGFLGLTSNAEGANNEITDIEVINGDIYIAGKFNLVGNFQTGSIARWVSSGRFWGGIGAPFKETIEISEMGSQIAASGVTATGDSNIRLFVNGQWLLVSAQTPEIINPTQFPKIFTTKNKLYAYGPFLIKGDTIDILINTGSAWQSSELKIKGQKLAFLSNEKEIFCFGDFSFTANNRNYKNIFSIQDQIVLLSGNIFGDENNNCQKDAAEHGVLAQVLIQKMFDKKEIMLVNTDEFGNWTAEIESGFSYTVKAKFVKKTFYNTCSQKIIPAQLGGAVLVNQNLALNFSTPLLDLKVKIDGLYGNIVPSNEQSYIYFTVTNAGNTINNNGSIHASFDSMLIIESILPAPSDQNKGNIIWNIQNLKPGQSTVFKIKIDARNIQGSLDFKLRTGTGIINNDKDVADNFDSLTATVDSRSSINFKTVSMPGRFSSLNYLQYGIYFTNIAPYTANSITIIDTIDTDLPLDEMQYLSNSHPDQSKLKKLITKDNIAYWTFENIMLPIAENNKANASGFFTYGFVMSDVAQKINEQRFDNTASIVFDYQHQTRTNTVSTILSSFVGITDIAPVSTQLLIYPNPAKQQIMLKNAISGDYKIYNAIGILVMEGIFNQMSNTLDINKLDAGIYIIKNGASSTTFIKEK